MRRWRHAGDDAIVPDVGPPLQQANAGRLRRLSPAKYPAKTLLQGAKA